MQVLVCASMCEFRGRNSVKGKKKCKILEKFSFSKKSKTVISVENRKLSRSRVTKRTLLLNSSHEI